MKMKRQMISLKCWSLAHVNQSSPSVVSLLIASLTAWRFVSWRCFLTLWAFLNFCDLNNRNWLRFRFSIFLFKLFFKSLFLFFKFFILFLVHIFWLTNWSSVWRNLRLFQDLNIFFMCCRNYTVIVLNYNWLFIRVERNSLWKIFVSVVSFLLLLHLFLLNRSWSLIWRLRCLTTNGLITHQPFLNNDHTSAIWVLAIAAYVNDRILSLHIIHWFIYLVAGAGYLVLLFVYGSFLTFLIHIFRLIIISVNHIFW